MANYPTLSSWYSKICLKDNNLSLSKQCLNVQEAVEIFFPKTEIFVCGFHILGSIKFPIYKIIWNSITIIMRGNFDNWIFSIDSPINIHIPQITNKDHKEYYIEEFSDNWKFPVYCEENKKKFTFCTDKDISFYFGFIVSSYFIAKESKEFKIASKSNSKNRYYKSLVDESIKEYQNYIVNLAEKLCKSKGQKFLNYKETYYIVNQKSNYFLGKYSEIEIRYHINGYDNYVNDNCYFTIFVTDESKIGYDKMRTLYITDFNDLEEMGEILEEYCKIL